MMRPPRFTLFFLLVVVTLSAIGVGVWRTGFQPRKLALVDTAEIEIGMNPLQVRYLLGPPHYTSTKNDLAWGYRIENNNINYQVIVFVNGKVERIQRLNWSPDVDGVLP